MRFLSLLRPSFVDSEVVNNALKKLNLYLDDKGLISKLSQDFTLEFIIEEFF